MPTSTRRVMGVVEAGYQLDASDSDWLGGILAEAEPDIQSGCGLYGFTCCIGPSRLEMGQGYAERDLAPEWAQQVQEFNNTIPDTFFRIAASRPVVAGSFLGLATGKPVFRKHLERVGGRAGVADAFAILAQDGESHAVIFGAPSRRPLRIHPRVGGLWNRVGTHLAAALRLRRHFAEKRVRPEALVEPGGRVAHAEGHVRVSSSAREVLARAVRNVDLARTAAVRREPEQALELWKGLVAGRWSLLDHWERDGRRYIAAYHNQPEVPDPRGLTEQQRMVLRFAALGGSNKEIAFTLGLSVSAVASAVSEISRKLTCRRQDLLAWAHPGRADHARLPTRGGEVGLLSVPHAPGAALERLSPAEQDVARLVLGGLSNSQIARQRRTSPRTVANQMRRIFERLAVRSRGELVQVLTRSPGASQSATRAG